MRAGVLAPVGAYGSARSARTGARGAGEPMIQHAIAGVRGYAVVLGAESLDVDAADRALAAWITQGDELLEPAPWRALALDAIA